MTQKEYMKCVKRCQKCCYGSKLNESLVICMYWAIVGHMRPSGGGPNCETFKPKKRGRRIVSVDVDV